MGNKFRQKSFPYIYLKYKYFHVFIKVQAKPFA